MKVYLVSFVGMEVDNDSSILSEFLKKRGIGAFSVCWDDPTVNWAVPDLCIIKSASNYVFDSIAFLEWAKKVEKTTPLWNNAKLLEWNSDKWYLKDLQENGVPIPPTVFISKDSHEDPKDILHGLDWDEIVIKPTISCGSIGLKRFKSSSKEAEQYLTELLSLGYVQELLGDTLHMPSSDAIIQPFIPEIRNGEVSMLYFGGEYSHAVIKNAPKDDFRAHPIWGATVERYNPSYEVKEMCDNMLRRIESVEYARVDLVNTPDGPLLIELELIEPFMFFDLFPETAETYAEHIEIFLKK